MTNYEIKHTLVSSSRFEIESIGFSQIRRLSMKSDVIEKENRDLVGTPQLFSLCLLVYLALAIFVVQVLFLRYLFFLSKNGLLIQTNFRKFACKHDIPQTP